MGLDNAFVEFGQTHQTDQPLAGEGAAVGQVVPDMVKIDCRLPVADKDALLLPAVKQHLRPLVSPRRRGHPGMLGEIKLDHIVRVLGQQGDLGLFINHIVGGGNHIFQAIYLFRVVTQTAEGHNLCHKTNSPSSRISRCLKLNFLT